MKRNLVFFILLVIVIIGGYFIFSFQSNKNNTTYSNGNRPVIAATIFPIADIAQNVAGDAVNVFAILPPGASPHTFEARPSDLQNIQKADKVFAVGNDLDNWVLELIDNPHNTVITVDVGIELLEFGEAHEHEHDEMLEEDHDTVHTESETYEEHEHEHDGVDPHYWLSLANAEIIARTIQNELSALYPEYADEFEANTEAYIADLQVADQNITALLSQLEHKELITFHDSWNYFARDYSFEIVGVFEPAPGKEPSPQYLKELHDTANEHNTEVVFTEPQLASDVVEPFVQDLGLQIFMLDPLGGLTNRDSYIKLMQYNAQTLYDALSQ